MSQTINYAVAKSAMSMIANQGRQGHLGMIGVSQADFDLLTGNAPWLPTDRNRMHVTLNALLNLSCDCLGVPRFQLPAEYVAAGIAVFVNPINSQSICRIMERSASAADIGGGNSTDSCSAEQLFALTVQLYGDNAASQARASFEKKTTLNIGKIIEDVKQ